LDLVQFKETLKGEALKGLNQAISRNFVRIVKQEDGGVTIFQNVECINPEDKVKQNLLKIQQNPWNLDILPTKDMLELKRREFVSISVWRNFRISKGVEWHKKVPQEHQIPLDALNDMTTHKARYYQEHNKFFRENRSLQDAIKDVVESTLQLEEYMQIGGSKMEGVYLDAIKYKMVVIGEASALINISGLYKDIDWQSIILLRNNLIHNHFRVKTEHIWRILSELRKAKECLIKS